MCGHVGVAGSLDTRSVRAFNDLLHFDSVRGMHSTGVLSVGRGKDPTTEVLKCVGPAVDLFELKRYDTAVSTGKSVLLGHNRHATVGRICRANAHPFEFSNIVLAHNGTIPYADRAKILDNAKFDTDSEAIANMINEVGVELTVPELYGAWAFVWYDKREHTINFLRNSERSLCWTFSKDRKQLFWSSEPGILHAALARHGIEYEKVWWFTEDQHNKFQVPTDWNKEFADPEVNTIRGREKSSETYQNTAWQHGAYQGWKPGGDDKKAAEKAAKEDKKGEEDQGLPFGSRTKMNSRPFGDLEWAKPASRIHKGGQKDRREIPCIVTVDGETLSEREFKARTSEACACCDNVINFTAIYEKQDRVKFINQTQFLCEECAEDTFMLNWFFTSSEFSPMYGKGKVH